MSFLERVMRGASRRSTTLANPEQWLVQALSASDSYSGKSVTVATALGLAPFWSGVQLLAGSVGMLPLKVYRPTAAGREEVPRGSRSWQLLHDKPNSDMAADEFWALVESHLDTWGNAFIWKERAGDGRIGNLWPLSPSRFQVTRRKNGDRLFVVDGKLDEPVGEFDILHIRALGGDGLVGYSPVQLHRQTLGSALARGEFGGRFWANDATPGVVLIHPNKLSPEAVNRVRALWDNRHKGPSKARETAVLAEGVKVEQMTMPLEDAQFIEQARFSATEQALILRIPPYMVAGDSGGSSLTYSTVEGQSVDFLKWSLGPRLVRLQNAVTWDGDIMPRPWFAEFLPDAVLRTTTKERFEAYALADFMTVDEKRARENLPPLDAGGTVQDESEIGDVPDEEDQ